MTDIRVDRFNLSIYFFIDCIFLNYRCYTFWIYYCLKLTTLHYFVRTFLLKFKTMTLILVLHQRCKNLTAVADIFMFCWVFYAFAPKTEICVCTYVRINRYAYATLISTIDLKCRQCHKYRGGSDFGQLSICWQWCCIIAEILQHLRGKTRVTRFCEFFCFCCIFIYIYIYV